MINFIARMKVAVKKGKGVRWTAGETRAFFEHAEGKTLVDNDELADLRDKAACFSYVNMGKRCKLCNRITVGGYVCIHCRGDDSDPDQMSEART